LHFRRGRWRQYDALRHKPSCLHGSLAKERGSSKERRQIQCLSTSGVACRADTRARILLQIVEDIFAATLLRQ
jgi:hypothetical protein